MLSTLVSQKHESYFARIEWQRFVKCDLVNDFSNIVYWNNVLWPLRVRCALQRHLFELIGAERRIYASVN